jgi:hypothetical protein
MDRPKNSTQERRGNEALDQELADLDVGEDADKVTGGGDPCEGGQFHKPR